MIDWSRVKELRDEVGEDDFRDLVEIFFEELDEITERIAGLAPCDIGEEDIHFLKGCALNLGFRKVSGLCQDMERRAGSEGLTANEARALIDACTASKAAFSANDQIAA